MVEFSRNPIKSKTAKIVMFAFAILIFLSALTLMGIDLKGFEVPLRLVGVILLFAVFINFVEIGIKRLTPLSDLKQLSALQIASLIIGVVVLATAILFLFNISPPFIRSFAPGLLFLEGLVVLLEIYI